VKEQSQIFMTAVMYFTRIPVPKWVKYSEDYLNKASMYFPFIGWIVGAIAAGIYWICSLVLPVYISVIISMISSVLLTGAFHEDAFADFCDGFGGGWTQQKILDIMKDSRVGTFAVTGLIFMLGLKFALLLRLAELNTASICISLIAAHSLSRFASTSLIYTHKYVKENEDSKAKPLAKKMSLQSFITAGIFGLVPMFLFPYPLCWIVIIPVFLTSSYFAHYFKKWIGGYTGDCLGAVQQICEVIFYLFMNVILWKFI
jgi:adenosylcobinamide-GDP ribazoletransferase